MFILDLIFARREISPFPLRLKNFSQKYLKSIFFNIGGISYWSPGHFGIFHEKIRQFVPQAVKKIPSLKYLNLGENLISELEKEMFQSLIKLETLMLDQNYLQDINGVFSSLSSLKNLSISDNSLKWFDMAFFPKTIQAINMSKNMIEEMGNYYKMFDGFSLLSLDLSFNRISFLNQQCLVVSKLIKSNRLNSNCPLYNSR